MRAVHVAILMLTLGAGAFPTPVSSGVFTTLGTTERVTVNSAGDEGNYGGWSASLSADGLVVAFESSSDNLVAGDINGVHDIFVRDSQAHVTDRVSRATDGTEANGHSEYPSISRDGRYVAFQSLANNLVPTDNNGIRDIFVHDRFLHQTERVNVSTSGQQANGESFTHGASGMLNSDGRFVVFQSRATNLAAADTDVLSDIFIRDRLLGVTELISVGASEIKGNDDSGTPSVSADGRYVAFYSLASNLVSGDTAGTDIFVRDRLSGLTERVSLGQSGQQGEIAGDPSISGDGRYVAFTNTAGNFVGENKDKNGTYDVFLRDRTLGTTELISVTDGGVSGNGPSLRGRVSFDGRFVAFESGATNLIDDDTNGLNDIFVRDRLLAGC